MYIHDIYIFRALHVFWNLVLGATLLQQLSHIDMGRVLKVRYLAALDLTLPVMSLISHYESLIYTSQLVGASAAYL